MTLNAAIIINHDIDKVEHTDFIFCNIEKFIIYGAARFIIYVHSTDQDKKEEISVIRENIAYRLSNMKYTLRFAKNDIHVSFPEDIDQLKHSASTAIQKTMKIIELDSSMLLSYVFFTNLDNLIAQPANLLFPAFHYKYNYKHVKHGTKKYKVKNFISEPKESFYQNSSNFKPDWDERLYMNHEIYEKMDGSLPIMSPTPILHNWGAYVNIIRDGKSDTNLSVPDSRMSVHIFEKIDPKVTFGPDVHLERTYSMERQDEFVYHVLAKHLNEPGFFLDIACATPQDASNTYVMEKYFDWDGIGFDIGDIENDHNWSKYRKSKFYQLDAISPKLTTTLKEQVGERIVDYISLDVDSNDNNFSALVLPRIMDAGIKFKVMTLEHESFRNGDSITKPTRKLLKDLGYDLLFEDVSFEDGKPWEDWWIKSDLLPYKNVMSIASKGLTFNECVEKIKMFKE